ncbi:MAG TPA: FRG domain-containing protein [Thermoanaerobaculia bacterium]|nr:FRG domain-containing protein [Thermoanaerobaculia bacterium]
MARQLSHNAWDRFLRGVKTEEERLGKPNLLWYRGVGDQAYRLLPSLLRSPVGFEKEPALFAKYRQLADRVMGSRENDWQYLFDMQHHHLPTRLLDWTEVLGVAVFFALLGDPRLDGAVYVLDPIRLNKRSGKADLSMAAKDSEFQYRAVYWENRPVKPILPIAVEPTYQSTRIHAQRARFTIHGNDPKPVEEMAPDCVGKVPLGKDAREAAQEFLQMAGIDEFSVFPDVVGMAPFIKRIVGI